VSTTQSDRPELPQPNRQLVFLIEEAHLSHYELARLVREALTRRGLPAKCTHHNVRRWCAPPGRYRPT